MSVGSVEILVLVGMIGVVVGGILLAWLVRGAFRRRIGRTVEQCEFFAEELGGTYNRALDKIEWQRGVLSMHLLFKPPMKISATVPGTLQRLEVKGAKGEEHKGEDLQILEKEENPLRHALFYEKGVDPKAFLTERVIRNLDLIYRLAYSPGFSLQVWAQGVQIKKSGDWRDDRSIGMFISLSLPVIDRAIHVCWSEAVEGKIEIRSEGAECQVCGSELRGRITRCAKCDTPHHKDCWSYTGTCSTYGCGGTETK